MLAENLPSYGSHYFLVRVRFDITRKIDINFNNYFQNKNNVNAYLGISFIGISVYNFHDRETPIKVIFRSMINNLFSILFEFKDLLLETIRKFILS